MTNKERIEQNNAEIAACFELANQSSAAVSQEVNEQAGLLAELKETLQKKLAGSSSGNKIELNIAYGDAPPEDTSKLWVKTSEPSGVLVSGDEVYAEGGQTEDYEYLSVSALKEHDGATGAVGTNIYSFGGRTQNVTAGSTTIRLYNTLTGTVTTLTQKLPYGACFMACATYGSKVYLFGGLHDQSSSPYTIYDSIIEFDTDTLSVDVLEEKLPSAMWGCCATTVGSNIYIFGGSTAIYRFDVGEKKIYAEPKALPASNRLLSCASVGSEIYLFGGWKAMQDIYCYNTETSELREIEEKLPAGRAMPACGAVENIICIMGGSTQTNLTTASTTETIWCFDTVTEKLTVSTKKAYPYMCRTSGVTVGTKVYSVQMGIAGYVAIYTPEFSHRILESGKLQIYPHATKNIFPLINTESVRVEMGIGMVHKGSSIGESEKVEAAIYKNGTWTTI